MSAPSAAKGLRFRYIIGLSAIALLVTASYITMQRVVSEQDNYATIVNLAGHQAGLANRIAFFASLMANTRDETEFNMARSQVGRSLNKMKEAHRALRFGAAEDGVPFITNQKLDIIYDDPTVGLENALRSFWERVDGVYNSTMESLNTKSSAYVFLSTYGPHVLEPLLDSAVDEYQQIGNASIITIERFELFIWLTALAALFLEIVFIFRPLEKNIKNTIETLESSVTELTATRERLVAAQHLASVGDWELFIPSGHLTWSDQVYNICGISRETFHVCLDSSMQYIHPEDRLLVRSSLQRVYLNGEPLSREYRIVRDDGSERLVYQRTIAKKSIDGRTISLVGTIQDVTERKELRNRLEKLAKNIPGFLFQLHLNTRGSWSLPYASKGILATCGADPEDVRNNIDNLKKLISTGDLQRITRKLEASGRNLDAWQDCFPIHHPHKGEIWIEANATPERLPDGGTLWYGYTSDITDRKCSEDKIKQLALFDPLTGLANRRLLNDRLTRALASASRNRSFGAVLMLDMDNFKTLNDTQGHDAGDALLVEISKRLSTCVRNTDTIARLGGDEFIIILEWLGNNEVEVRRKSMAVAEKIRTELGKNYEIGEDRHIHHASASIGVALFKGNERNPIELLKHADVAMFEAKETGRNRVCLYSEARQSQVDTRMTILTNLRQACLKNEFSLYYQPQLNRVGAVCGAEALIRWFPPNSAPISPGIFIPVAEESGLILPIGEWVLETVCRQMLMLRHLQLPREFAVAINISARQFGDDHFLDKVTDTINRSGIDPRRLKFELTETYLIRDLDRAKVILKALRETGLRVELDDFGTGYSALNSLKELPLDTLKLDGSLVQGLNGDRRDDAIVKAAIAMAKALSLSIIAEGVETDSQRKFLIREGCDILQGYLFARPMPFNEFVDYLIKNHAQAKETMPGKKRTTGPKLLRHPKNTLSEVAI